MAEQIDIALGRPANAKMTEGARIRRLQDTLTVAGFGVIAFAAWSVVKAILLFFLLDEASQRELLKLSDGVPMQVFYIMFAIVAFADLLMRLYVGRSAQAEGRGKRKGFAYIVFAALMAIMSIVSIVLTLLGVSSSPTVVDLIMSVVIEATSFATLALMIYCAVRLRRLRRSAG